MEVFKVTGKGVSSHRDEGVGDIWVNKDGVPHILAQVDYSHDYMSDLFTFISLVDGNRYCETATFEALRDRFPEFDRVKDDCVIVKE